MTNRLEHFSNEILFCFNYQLCQPCNVWWKRTSNFLWKSKQAHLLELSFYLFWPQRLFTIPMTNTLTETIVVSLQSFLPPPPPPPTMGCFNKILWKSNFLKTLVFLSSPQILIWVVNGSQLIWCTTLKENRPLCPLLLNLTFTHEHSHIFTEKITRQKFYLFIFLSWYFSGGY